MLVEGRVGALIDQRPVGRLAALGEVRGNHDAGGLHLAFDTPVLVEAPVHQVLVVRDGHVKRDHQPPRSPDLRAGGRIHVLPQDPVIFLVDADGVRYGPRLASGVVQYGVQVGDLAQAVAAALQ